MNLLMSATTHAHGGKHDILDYLIKAGATSLLVLMQSFRNEIFHNQ